MPYGFVVTSHFVWTVYFSLSICLGIFFIGLINYKIKFLKLFVPEVPLLLYILMIPIESFSYILRSFSLAIRLSANIIAGHILVHIIADFVLVLRKLHQLIVIIPFIFLLAIFVLELGVACLQEFIIRLTVEQLMSIGVQIGHSKKLSRFLAGWFFLDEEIIFLLLIWQKQ